MGVAFADDLPGVLVLAQSLESRMAEPPVPCPLGERDVATLLAHTLGDEESSDFLLTELSKPLMQQASSDEAGIESKAGRPRKQKA